MQSGSINQANKSFIKRPQSSGVEDKEKSSLQDGAKAEGDKIASPQEAENSPAPSGESVALGLVLDVAPEALRTKEDGKGGYESEMTFAFVPKADKEKLSQQGVLFPDVKQAVLGDGVGPNGSLEVVPLYDTQNENLANVARTIEVDKALLAKDPETGFAPIDNHTPVLLAEGEGILAADQRAVAKGATVIPEGYQAKLGLSQAGSKVESKRVLVNNLTKGFGTFSGSSLAGVMNIPVISQLAPILALGSAGFAFNQNMEAKKDAVDQLAYLDQQIKKSPNDMVPMETAGGEKFHVSGKNERVRLKAQVQQANLQLASTGLLAAAGGTSIIGSMAGAGVAGFAGLAGAAAAAPFLAGGALVLGNGAMVFNSLNQLKELSKERSELLARQEKGETHVDQVLEVMNPALGRATAVGEKPIPVPISERLKQVEKEQRKQRLLASALSGAVVSIGSTITGLGAASVVGPIAMAPAAAILSGQSISQLRKLSAEKKELQQQAAEGKTMVERQLQQADGTWRTERVPISTLLSENKKDSNKHKLILTSVGSVGAIAGMTLGAGMSLLAAAPLALVPLAIGAALFPDKVKAFADKVMSLLSGTFGEAGSSAREVAKHTEAETDKFNQKVEESLAGLKESNPELFEDRPGRLPLTKMKYGGYFTEMKKLAKDYATSSSQADRHAILRTMEQAIAEAPDAAQPGLAAFREHLTALSMEVEAQWLARDISLEMKTPVTDKVVNDDRVKSRVKELEFPSDNLREQYEESLHIENSQAKADALIRDSESGDRDASRKLARTQVFKAARILATTERDLGVGLYTKYMDAIQRPEDEDNLELLLKEVGYRQQTAVSGQEVEIVSEALKTLNTPLALAPESPDLHMAKFQAAVQEMTQADPDLTAKLLETDEKTSNPDTFKGMNAQQALAERTKLNAQFQAAKRGLRDKAPEALKTWQEADQKLKTLARTPTSQVSPAPQAVILQGPEARMETAFRSLSEQEPKLAQELGDAFALLNSPQAYQGLEPQQIQQAKVAANLKLSQVRGKLQNKQPELMKLWDGARNDVEKAYFERSVDHQFKDKVLATTAVSEAAERLGLNNEDVEGLYMGLMKSQILHDPRALEARMADETGAAVDPKKAEMLAVIDRAMLKTASEVTQGGADFQQPNPEVKPDQDPNVVKFLQQHPEISQVLESEQMQALSANMQLPVEQVKDAYLTLVQAEMNPLMLADFQGRMEAGEMETVKTYQVGQAVVALINQATRPSPEVVSQQLEQSMKGVVVQSVLQHPEITAQAEALKVDAEATMKLLLTAELSRDPSLLGALEAKAQKGDTGARNQLQLLQTLSQAVLQVSNQVAAQQQNTAA